MNRTDAGLRDTYAAVLFEIADERKMPEAVMEDIELICGVIEQEWDFIRFLISPCFSLPRKEIVVEKIFGGKITDTTRDFLMVLLKHNRSGLLPEIAAEYRRLWDARCGCVPVTVLVSESLEQRQVDVLTANLSAALGGIARLKVEMSDSIMGGVVIRWEGKSIDNSIRSRLRSTVKTVVGHLKGRN